MMVTNRSLVRSILILGLIASFALMSLGMVLTPNRAVGDDAFSERLIRDSLLRLSEQGDSDVGQFMVAFEEAVHIAAVRNILGPEDVRDVYPYISNYNGQYETGRLLVEVFGFSGADAYRALKVLSILATAGVVALIVAAVLRDFGKVHALAVLIPFVFSVMFLNRAHSAYWQIYLSLLPFAVVMFVYPLARNGGRFALLSAIIGVLVLLKSLTGYEYLTSITLACMVPIFYHEINLHGYTRAGWLRVLKRCFIIGLACVVGFALALLLHLNKLTGYFGSFEQALSALRLISEYSMLESESGIRGGAPTPGSFVWAMFDTFLLRNFVVNMSLTYLLILILVFLLLDRSEVDLQARAKDYFRSALFVATLLSLLASISWSIVMVKHAVAHPHINWVQTYLSFYVFLSLSVAQVCARPAGIDKER